MDAFEQVVKSVMNHRGYWVIQGFKVNLTKAEKVRVGRASAPRWEIDILAYNVKRNELIALECKSYLDSPGVRFNEVFNASKKANRYKLFNEAKLRKIVLGRLRLDCLKEGLINTKTKVRLGLVAGKVVSSLANQQLQAHFEKMDWLYIPPSEIRSLLRSLGEHGYHDDVAMVAVKLLGPKHGA
jgi:hypothetical protein